MLNGLKTVKIVNVSSFEKHAGSSARRPSDYIFLENGNSLHKVLESGWKARDRKSNVLVALRMAIGEACSESSGSKKSCCSKCGFADGELVSCSGASCMNLCHPGRPSVTHCTSVQTSYIKPIGLKPKSIHLMNELEVLVGSSANQCC
jgi:hypothetical protein